MDGQRVEGGWVDEWGAHQDCRALHLHPRAYDLLFTSSDGQTMHNLAHDRGVADMVGDLSFIEQQVLAAICKAVVREVEKIGTED